MNAAADAKTYQIETPAGEITHLLTEWIAQLRRPMFLVEEDMRLVWANDAADNHLAERIGLERQGEQLAAVDAAFQPLLAAFVERLGHAPRAFVIPRFAGDGHLTIHGRRIASSLSDRHMALVIEGTRPGHEYADLAPAFGLTKTEHRVLLALLEGLKPEDIARDQRVSIETTRSHIRQIYSKLQVSSRVELFRKVLPFRLT